MRVHSRELLKPLAAAVALLGCLAVAPAAHAAPVEPANDPFYTGPVALKGVPNGTVLRSRPVTTSVYGLPTPNASARQILYRSTNSKGKRIAVVTTLIVPTTPYPGGGPRPLVGYQPAIDSLGDQCNPSYTLQTGTEKEGGSVQALLGMGYAVAVTDFEAQYQAFAAGPLAGRAVLDGLRASEALPDTGLAGKETPVGIVGYSGGGQATAWATELQPTYAPELNLVGAAFGGTPADIELSVKQILGGPFAGLGFLGIFGVERDFPELRLDDLLNARGMQLKRDVADACLTDAAGSYPFARIEDYTTVPDAFALPRVQAVLAELHLGKVRPSAPVYQWHSVLDELIPVGVEDALATRYCSQGAKVQYTREASGDHNTEAVAGQPAAFRWLADRFNGVPAPTNCGTFPAGAWAPGYGKFDCDTAAPLRLRIRRLAGRHVRRVVVRSDGSRILSRRRHAIRRISVKGLSPGYAELTLRLRGGGRQKVRHVARIVECA